MRKDRERLVVKVRKLLGWLQIRSPQMAKEKEMEHLVDEEWQLEN